MPSRYVTKLPDPVYGSASTAPTTEPGELNVSAGDGVNPLLHAHFGGLYIGMSERNWRTLFAALGELEILATPAVTHRIRMDDDSRTATITTEVSA